MSVSVWLAAFRLRTLPLALSSIAMGSFLAAAANAFRWDIFFLCVITTICLQILSNLANDYGDTIHGADSLERKGPNRAVQAGLISPDSMKSAMIIFGFLSLASGLTLLFLAFGYDWSAILFFLVLGLICIAAAIAYTVGKKPYGYLGLGDVSVLIFFGFVGVLGSYYLFTKSVSWSEVFPALSCGTFAVGVLNINNIRDIESDRAAGKYSVPVRIGRSNAVRYHWVLLIAGIVAAFVYTWANFSSYEQLLFVLAVPLFVKNGLTVSRNPSHVLDPMLKQMALSTLAFVLLFGVGLLLAKL